MLTSASLTLVLGATGKTGSRVANRLLSPIGGAIVVPTSGHGSRANSDVEKATGAAPASFADFARRTAAAWAVDQAR
jgi:nucleoside-diphosphate-sugar epimerase